MPRLPPVDPTVAAAAALQQNPVPSDRWKANPPPATDGSSWWNAQPDSGGLDWGAPAEEEFGEPWDEENMCWNLRHPAVIAWRAERGWHVDQGWQSDASAGSSSQQYSPEQIKRWNEGRQNMHDTTAFGPRNM